MPQAESNVEYLNSNKRNGHPGLMVDGGTNSHPDCPQPYTELLGSRVAFWFALKLTHGSHSFQIGIKFSAAMTDIELIWISSTRIFGRPLIEIYFWQIVIGLDNDSPSLLSTGLYGISTNNFRILRLEGRNKGGFVRCRDFPCPLISN